MAQIKCWKKDCENNCDGSVSATCDSCIAKYQERCEATLEVMHTGLETNLE